MASDRAGENGQKTQEFQNAGAYPKGVRRGLGWGGGSFRLMAPPPRGVSGGALGRLSTDGRFRRICRRRRPNEAGASPAGAAGSGDSARRGRGFCANRAAETREIRADLARWGRGSAASAAELQADAAEAASIIPDRRRGGNHAARQGARIRRRRQGIVRRRRRVAVIDRRSA